MTAPNKTINGIIRQNIFRKKHKKRIKLWIQRYEQVLHTNGMIPSRVSQHKMAKREIMWNDWDSNLVLPAIQVQTLTGSWRQFPWL